MCRCAYSLSQDASQNADVRIPRERRAHFSSQEASRAQMRVFLENGAARLAVQALMYVFLENGAHLHCQNLLNCTPARKRSTPEPPGRVFLDNGAHSLGQSRRFGHLLEPPQCFPTQRLSHKQWPGGLREA